MNILVLNWRDQKHPEAGGAEVHLHEIFSRLVKWGHHVVLLTTRFKGCSTRDEQDGIHVYRLGHTFTFNWEAPYLARALIKKHHIDCIVDDVNKIPFFSSRWHPKLPVGVFFHHLFGRTLFELTSPPMASYVLFLENLSAWGYRNTHCCTVSQSTLQELQSKGFDSKLITIVENSVDTDRFSIVDSVSKEPDLLLFTGRLKRYKNVDFIMNAMKRLAEQGIVLRLAIAGAGDDEIVLRKHASALGLAENVQFFGYISEKEKIDLYRRAALFVNPSLKEGWGITNIEANACGTTVVANDAPGLRDSVRHGETGLLYKENDLDSCVDSIRLLLRDNQLRNKLERNGRQWALSFSWDQSARKVEEWLQKIVS